MAAGRGSDAPDYDDEHHGSNSHGRQEWLQRLASSHMVYPATAATSSQQHQQPASYHNNTGQPQSPPPIQTPQQSRPADSIVTTRLLAIPSVHYSVSRERRGGGGGEEDEAEQGETAAGASAGNRLVAYPHHEHSSHRHTAQPAYLTRLPGHASPAVKQAETAAVAAGRVVKTEPDPDPDSEAELEEQLRRCTARLSGSGHGDGGEDNNNSGGGGNSITGSSPAGAVTTTRGSGPRSRVSPASSLNGSQHGGQGSQGTAGGGSQPPPPEQDKKMRREIANSNERRRMMCINNGFVNLQMILPKHYMKRGEKMSKAAVLQSTVDYIGQLVAENAKLQAKNEALQQQQHGKTQSSSADDPEGVASDALQSRSRGTPGAVTVPSTAAAASAKDLVAMVRSAEKYTRERQLRSQTVEEFRRVVSDLAYCPAGCATKQRDVYSRLQQTSSPDHRSEDHPDGAAMGATTVDYMKLEPVQYPTSLGQQEERETPVIISIPEDYQQPIVTGGTRGYGKRKSPTAAATVVAAMEEPELKPKPLTGFEILYQAITFSEGNLDGNRSDSGCSEETFDSCDPPKKRHRAKHSSLKQHQAQPQSSGASNMERVCS